MRGVPEDIIAEVEDVLESAGQDTARMKLARIAMMERERAALILDEAIKQIGCSPGSTYHTLLSGLARVIREGKR